MKGETKMSSRNDVIYDGCACQEFCVEGCARYPQREKCVSFYRFVRVQRKNKKGKIINKWSKVEV